MKRIFATMTVVSATVLLAAGCGEIDQTAKTQKVYAGKKDERPYDGKAFGDDKAKWHQALAERNKGQNEYLRTEPAKK
jgi:hypothetical protein